MAEQKQDCFLPLLVYLALVFLCNGVLAGAETEYISAVGDPGMKRDNLRVAIESWNQCNEVGEEAPHMGSPRGADCFDIYKASSSQSNSMFSYVFHILLSVV